MSKIRVLPEHLANQIAAGEVVERPASVVKELLENALDAGAGQIEIQVEGDGSRLIRVIDDGEGMDQDDLLLCLERHATSKLSSIEQLNAITTMGFRGEAIPSIASVSRMTITSRRPDATLGAQVTIRYGKIERIHDMGAAAGTTVEVQQLFGNLPARRKFIRSARTELAHVEEVVVAYALANPSRGFRYRVGGRQRLHLEATDDLLLRCQQVLQLDDSSLLVPLRAEPDADGIGLAGCLLAPHYDKAFRLRLFVNGRAVRDRMLQHAVAEGGHGFYLRGRRPAGIVFLTLPPAMVDVNVHPTKQEVRFRNNARIHNRIVAVVRQGLVELQKELRFSVFGDAGGQPSTGETAPVAGAFAAAESSAPVAPEPQRLGVTPRPYAAPAAVQPPVAVHEPKRDQEPSRRAESVVEQGAATGSDQTGGGLSIIGQLFDSYILCQEPEKLIVIDQHAAQERLLYERLREQFFGDSIVRQTLMFPAVIELSAPEVAVVEQQGGAIVRLGIELQEFGGNSYLLKAVPALLSHLDPQEIVCSVLDRFRSPQTARANGATRFEDVLSVMACKAAVKANHRLKVEEIVHLLDLMEDARVFSHCPHGRPVFKIFAADQVKKWFFRS